jgi:hypothetical protein
MTPWQWRVVSPLWRILYYNAAYFIQCWAFPSRVSSHKRISNLSLVIDDPKRKKMFLLFQKKKTLDYFRQMSFCHAPSSDSNLKSHFVKPQRGKNVRTVICALYLMNPQIVGIFWTFKIDAQTTSNLNSRVESDYLNPSSIFWSWSPLVPSSFASHHILLTYHVNLKL